MRSPFGRMTNGWYSGDAARLAGGRVCCAWFYLTDWSKVGILPVAFRLIIPDAGE